MFKQCYACEKIHGTSANVRYNAETKELKFFSGGAKHEQFLALFDQEKLKAVFEQNYLEHPTTKSITVYGEAYGGKLQGMSATYGKDLKFVAFEVLINEDQWLGVPQADRLATSLGFEFVHYELIDTTEEAINAAIMADSVQAVRNGLGPGHMREGVVLHPPIEVTINGEGRIICKHKRPEFAEREHTPKFSDPDEIKALEDAKAISEEWVTVMRLQHVLDAFPEPKMEDATKIIKAMLEDVSREASGEIIESKAARKEIGKRTMKLFKQLLTAGTFN